MIGDRMRHGPTPETDAGVFGRGESLFSARHGLHEGPMGPSLRASAGQVCEGLVPDFGLTVVGAVSQLGARGILPVGAFDGF
jgi:hypothetical protein